MVESTCELIVFPTELAMRRYQQEQALEHGWVDASCHTTFARIRKLCLPYAGLKGRQLKGAKELLERKQAAEVASGYFEGEVALGRLSINALGDVLERVLAELAALPEEAPGIMEWLLHQEKGSKLNQLGTLASIWRAQMKQDGYVDRLDINLAILKLLKGSRGKWPPLLRDARQITFRSVRWFNPFEEACVLALNQKMKVRVESALPPAHAEVSADRMGQRIRSEIMMQPWAAWTEDLGDTLAVDSPDVLEPAAAARIGFSRSAGAYGEIEDLARRICWTLEQGNMPPNRIALVVPNLGAVQDIVPHVFGRFRIPYFFRRGRPVLSSPCVKAFLAWLAFPLRSERDALIDLIRNPAIHFDGREDAVEQLLKMPPRLKVGQASLPVFLEFQSLETCSGARAAEILRERIVEPEDHFNSEALKTLESMFEEIGDQALPLAELVDLIEALLEDETVKPRDSHEQGVWVLNPHDAVGLEFDLVLFTGLNEGEFPSVPQQDALLSDKERYRLRRHLEEQGRPLPKMALSESGVKFEQESVMFLSALGMAREQLVFSYQSADHEGNEKGEGEYYRKLWNLAGWCVQEEIIAGPYDTWRIEQLEEDNVFSTHMKLQRDTDPEDRVPMPGESFLPIVPLPLCRAKDEALQAAVQGRLARSHSGACDREPCDTENVPSPARLLTHLVNMLNIEAERDVFLETPVSERTGSVYCGHIDSLKEKVAEWFGQHPEISPTALEVLAQCRYVFLLEKVFGLGEERAADDTPDPMDRGSLIHSILKNIYAAIANGEAGVDAPRCWAVKTADGWRLRTEGGVDAIPLASFVPEHIDYARGVALRFLDQAELGHPGVWAAEREKVLEQVLNFVRHDVATCSAENRYPALFELKFGGASAVDLGEVKLKGMIDRIDLVFADAGELTKVRVFDYKGLSRARRHREDYIEEIQRNLDCQLPVYAFAAQQFFFGECNTDAANAMTEAGYLFYQREMKKISSELKKCLIPMNEDGLIDGFLATLFESIRRLKDGDFAVDPLVETYNDYQSVCRTEAVALEELDHF